MRFEINNSYPADKDICIAGYPQDNPVLPSGIVDYPAVSGTALTCVFFSRRLPLGSDHLLNIHNIESHRKAANRHHLITVCYCML
jgi:hypothetical protein